MSVNEAMTAIANAIRKNTTINQVLKLEDMPSAIEAVASQNYEKGKAEGGGDGYDEGYEAGKAAERDEFWEAFQQKGNRTSYPYAFYGDAWTDAMFNPKYVMHVTGTCPYMFYKSRITDYDKLSTYLDFSEATNITYLFAQSTVTHLPTLNFTKVTTAGNAFAVANDLVTIDKIIINSDGSFPFTASTFNSCAALKEIRFEGVIGCSVALHVSSLLSADSAKDIILHLANYKGTDKEFAYTIQFHAKVWEQLNAEGNASPNNNTWDDYLTDIGWNA